MTGDDGAVRVQRPDGEILGSGFLVAERRVLTCAHVVEGLDEVEVVFLAAAGARARAARVTSRAYDGKGQDLAVLELVDEPPEAARPLRLKAASAGGRFRALGFPTGHDHGLWIHGTAAGPNLLGWVQIEPDGARDVARGFSGGAAWSDERQAAVGMVVARSGERVAWMIPAVRLHETFPEIPLTSAPPPPAETRSFRSMAIPPEQYVDRVVYRRLLAALTGTGGTRVALTTALRGAGGYGKTTLAQALCADPAVRAAYPAGILWTTMGENLRPADRLARLRDLLRFWKDEEPPAFETATAAGAALRQALAGHRVLLVVDDVWDPADLAPLHGLGGEAALLVTTRDRRNVPRDAVPFDVDEMRRDEAVALLAASLPAAEVAERLEPLRALTHRLGEWPLLLSLVNRQLFDRVRDGLGLGAALAEVNHSLDAHGLEAFDRDDTEARQEAVSRTLAASLDRLKEEERARFFALAVFPEDADVPLAVVAPFWGLSLAETTRECSRLRDLSLLRDLDRAGGTLRLHDVVRAYLLTHSPSPEEELHRLLLDALRPPTGKWQELPPEPLYPWHHLAQHLVAVGSQKELQDLLFDLDWLGVKLQRVGVNAVLGDCEPLLYAPDVARLHAALVLSAQVLGRDPSQLPGQLLSRLTVENVHSSLNDLLDACRARGGLLHLRPGSHGPGNRLVRILQGHTRAVVALAVLDERRVVSGSSDRTLRVWDLVTGETVRILTGHTAPVRAVAVLDSGRVLSSSWDDTLRLWEIETGESLCIRARDADGVGAVAMIESGQAVSASGRCGLCIWDLDSCAMIGTLEGHTGCINAVTKLDERRVVSASDDTTLRVWDLDTGNSRTLEGHGGSVRSVARLDDRRILSASEDGTLRVWDVESGKVLRVLKGHDKGIEAVAAIDEKRVISASADRSIRVWDIEDTTTLQTIDAHTEVVRSIAVLDERRVVSGSDDSTLRLWDLNATTGQGSFVTHRDWVTALCFADDRRVLSASIDRTLRVWDLPQGECQRTLAGHTDEVSAIAAVDDCRVVSAAADGTLRLWDLDTGKTLRVLKGHTDAVRAVTTLDSQHVVSASADQTLRLWDLRTGKTVRTHRRHTTEVCAVVALDSRHILSASFDGRLLLWDLDTGETLSANGHSGWSQPLALVHKMQLISVSTDRTLRLWDMKTGVTLQNFHGHTDIIKSVAVLDQQHFVSASLDRTLRVWHVETGRPLAIATLDESVISVATHPLTRTVVAGDASGRVHFLRYDELS